MSVDRVLNGINPGINGKFSLSIYITLFRNVFFNIASNREFRPFLTMYWYTGLTGIAVETLSVTNPCLMKLFMNRSDQHCSPI